LTASDAAAAARTGAWIIDLRSSEEFGAGHPEGALHIGFGTKVGYWAGWVVPGDARIVLLGSSSTHIQNVQPQLLRVGLDRIEGFIAGGFEAWTRAGLPVESVPQIDVRELRGRLERREPFTLLDVRTKKEYAAGHIDGAVNMPVGDLPRAAAIPAGSPVATMCEGGFRSSLAASLLLRAGTREIINVTGGMSAYRATQAHEE
jgi:hydroxyacylglutathione hydrolase